MNLNELKLRLMLVEDKYRERYEIIEALELEDEEVLNNIISQIETLEQAEMEEGILCYLNENISIREDGKLRISDELKKIYIKYMESCNDFLSLDIDVCYSAIWNILGQ